MSDISTPAQGQHPDPHHSHDHGHPHTRPASFDEVRTMAIESLLIEKGFITAAEVDNVISMFVSNIGPM